MLSWWRQELGLLGAGTRREGGMMELRSARSIRRSKAFVGHMKRRRGRPWWRAVLNSDAVILAGHNRHPRSHRLRYIIHDALTTRTFAASEHACRAYAHAVIARRALVRRVER